MKGTSVDPSLAGRDGGLSKRQKQIALLHRTRSRCFSILLAVVTFHGLVDKAHFLPHLPEVVYPSPRDAAAAIAAAVVVDDASATRRPPLASAAFPQLRRRLIDSASSATTSRTSKTERTVVDASSAATDDSRRASPYETYDKKGGGGGHRFAPHHLDVGSDEAAQDVAVVPHDTRRKQPDAARFLFAPVDGKSVYTMNKYILVSSERDNHGDATRKSGVDDEAPQISAATSDAVSKRILLSSDVETQPFRQQQHQQQEHQKTRYEHQQHGPVATISSNTGRSIVEELRPEQFRRTTMREPIAATVSATTPAADLALLEANAFQRSRAFFLRTPKFVRPKNMEASRPDVHAILQLVSHDTSSSRSDLEPSESVQRWQAPTSLKAAREAATAAATAAATPNGSVLLPDVNDVFAMRQARLRGSSGGAARATLDGSTALATVPLSAVASKARQPIKSPTAAFDDVERAPSRSLLSATTTAPSAASAILQRPRPSERRGQAPLQPSPTSSSVAAAAAALTNRTHTSRRPTIHYYHVPLPTVRVDESDFDLLMPATTTALIPPQHILSPAHQAPPIYPQQPLPFIHYASSPSLAVGHPQPVSALTPNAKLELCCRKQSVSANCQNLCNFDTFTDRSLVSAVLGNHCPGGQLQLAFDCATTRADHTECCRRANIHLHAGGQCMPFCETHRPTPPNILSYFPCLQVFDTIKTCYRDHQLRHPNIFGD